MTQYYLAGSLASPSLKIDLSWGYIHFNLATWADADRLQCAKDFSLLEVNPQRQRDVVTALQDSEHLRLLAGGKSNLITERKYMDN